MKVAWLGLGQMGAPMATRLLQAGHDLTVWNRTPARADALVDQGAHPATAPAQAASSADVVFTMLADPDALEEVLFGEGGLASALPTGAPLVDMSTIGPEAVRRLAERVPAGSEVLDAPVLGSVPQATDGDLRIFVGGDTGTFERVRPLLEELGRPVHLGPLGTGAAMKLVANATLGTLMSGLGEALALADALGLQEDAVLDVLAESPIGVTVKSKRERIETGVYPPNFKLSLAAKDLQLVTDAAASAGVPYGLASAARAYFEAAQAAGLEAFDYSAVVAHLRDHRARGPEE